METTMEKKEAEADGGDREKPIDPQRRDFMKATAAAAAATATVTGTAGVANAYNFREDSKRYVPPGQWWSHFDWEWYEFPSDDPEAVEVWGYTDKISYKPGETVAFHVTTGATTFNLKIFRDGGTYEEVYSAEGITGQRSPTPDDAYEKGCEWPSLHTWTLPQDLRSGFYVVIFSIQRGEQVIEQEAGFCVRPSEQKSSIVYILATSTWCAYNDWAGGSYYAMPGAIGGGSDFPTGDTSDVPMPISPRVHLHRPWARGFMRLPLGADRAVEPNLHRPKGHMNRYRYYEFGLTNGYSKFSAMAGWAAYDRYFAIWAERNGYELDYVTQHDLHADPDLLGDYKCAVLIGHDEYWSWTSRESLDNWIENGGKLARFAGNMLFNVRYEDDGLVQVCYKSYAPDRDPYAKDPEKKHLTATIFDDIRFGNWPLTQTFASSSVFGHLSGIGGASPRTPGFTVYRPEHWLLEGTDLYYGDAFAAAYVRFECDGVPYTFKNGYPVVTKEMGTPQNIEIAALFPTTNGEDYRPPEHSPVQLGANDGYKYDFVNTRYGVTVDEATQEQKDSVERGCGILASMPKGKGEVATAAVCDWAFGLGKDPYVDQITHNVLRRFSS